MVAHPDLSVRYFRPGQPVRLLGCFLIWPAQGHANGRTPGFRGMSGTTARSAAPKYFSGRTLFLFVRQRPDKPGGSIVHTDDGRQWFVPDSALVAVFPEAEELAS